MQVHSYVWRKECKQIDVYDCQSLRFLFDSHTDGMNQFKKKTNFRMTFALKNQIKTNQDQSKKIIDSVRLETYILVQDPDQLFPIHIEYEYELTITQYTQIP
jgi:hypothetical protein